MRALLCSIDGLRPDALSATPTPTISRLIATGSSTLFARSVMPSVTLPCHTSMLRGVDVPRHGITSNTFAPLARPVPSVLDVAAANGKRVGFFYNWEPLRDLAAPGSLSVSAMFGDAHRPGSDEKVADAAVRALHADDLDFVFVYFGHVDEVGHAHGWMSDEYLDAVTKADACLARVIDAYESLGRWRETLSLTISDHGGHGRSHGTDCAEDMTIPFILRGPNVKAGHALQTPVRLYDAAPTLAHALNVPADRAWDGQIVTEAFEPLPRPLS